MTVSAENTSASPAYSSTTEIVHLQSHICYIILNLGTIYDTVVIFAV